MGARVAQPEVGQCLSAYAGIGSIEEIKPMQGAFHNTLYRVTTDRGVFYLKVLSTHPLESTEERYQHIAAVMGRVASLGLQAPLPLRNRRGLLLTRCGPLPAVLSAEVTGEPFDESDLVQVGAAGRALARVHEATRDLATRRDCWLGELGDFLVTEEALAWSLPETSEGAAIRERLGELVARSGRIAQELATGSYQRLPRTVIHSEYCAKHLRVCGSEVTGLLDFEYAHPNARALDVALALTHFRCIGPEADEYGTQRARAFLSAYNCCAPRLADEELLAVPLLVKVWDFECITFWVHHVARTRNSTAGFDLRERIATSLRSVDWWQQHSAESREALQRAASGGSPAEGERSERTR